MKTRKVLGIGLTIFGAVLLGAALLIAFGVGLDAWKISNVQFFLLIIEELSSFCFLGAGVAILMNLKPRNNHE